MPWRPASASFLWAPASLTLFMECFSHGWLDFPQAGRRGGEVGAGPSTREVHAPLKPLLLTPPQHPPVSCFHSRVVLGVIKSGLACSENTEG